MALFRGRGPPLRMLSRGAMRADISAKKFSISCVKRGWEGMSLGTRLRTYTNTHMHTRVHTPVTPGPLTAPGPSTPASSSLQWPQGALS